MKLHTRMTSLVAALALLGCAALPVAAEDILVDGSSSVYAAAARAADTDVPPAEEDVPVETPQPSENPYSSTGAYVTAATVTDLAGGEISTIEWGDHVNVIIKVVDHSAARNHIAANQIAARVNSSTFTYTGTAEISQLVEDQDAEGPYYSYVLLFRDVVYNGGGNTFPIDLSYLDSSMQMQQFSVTLGQCVDKDPNDPSKLRTPNLVVRSSSYGTETIEAGTPFMLSMTVYATSGTEPLNDVVVSVTLPDGISLTGGSLSTYVGSMSPQSTNEVSFSVLPSAGYTTNVANISVSMTGTGAQTGAAASGSTTISVPIAQPDRFEVGQLQVTDSVYVGEYTSISLNFVNKGKNPVGNVEATLTGTNLGVESASQYIGNLNPGTESSVDFDLTPSEVGPASGTITLTYEGADGSIQTTTKDFSMTVMEYPIYDDPTGGMDIPVEPEQTGVPVIVWVLIGAAVLVVIVVVVVVVRKRRKAAKLAELEGADDEDF